MTPGVLREKDENILKLVADRSRPAQAPEPLKPTNNFPTPEAAKAEFSKRRAGSIEYVRSTKDDLRNHAVVSGGPIGIMDAYQQLLLMAAHTERHTAQINEVKAATGYPK